jgi:hypothetical protein
MFSSSVPSALHMSEKIFPCQIIRIVQLPWFPNAAECVLEGVEGGGVFHLFLKASCVSIAMAGKEHFWRGITMGPSSSGIRDIRTIFDLRKLA